MSKSSENVKRWRRGLKLSLIAGFDGQCQICGYAKCTRALELHHLKEEDKNFGFGFVISHCRNWELICAEAHKCVLLCANCHAEVHDGITMIPPNIVGFNQEKAENKKREILGEAKRKRRLNDPLGRAQEREELFHKKEKSRKTNQIKSLPYSVGEKVKKVEISGIDFSTLGWTEEVSAIIGVEEKNVHGWMKRNMTKFYKKCFKHTSYKNRWEEEYRCCLGWLIDGCLTDGVATTWA